MIPGTRWSGTNGWFWPVAFAGELVNCGHAVGVETAKHHVFGGHNAQVRPSPYEPALHRLQTLTSDTEEVGHG